MDFVLPIDDTITDIAETMSARYSERHASSVVFFLTIAQTAIEIRHGVDVWLRDYGLSQGRFAVLMCLNLRPDAGFTPSEIAARISTTRATITGLATGLERDGFVRREAMPGDRRKVRLILTDKGKALLAELVPTHLRRLAHLLSDITPEERATVLSVIARIRAAQETMPEHTLGEEN